MLDRTNNERACVGLTESEWLGLTKFERRLVGLYRRLSEQEQLQLRRLSEVLATNPEETARR
ncbi:hypothetical protein C1Y08_07590 [Pseudomonas sp. FW306-02-F02-AA]|uniref:hypothetical protein n=1 Tax=Pseudomonas TaxID=286 RepID=UPI0009C0CE53|nr:MULTISPECIES: hypothetical protein [Pseudomonas]PMZ04635.1 hypothetical protein C1Y07_07885 [Pseudomonas sp. FW306-02-F02-AB]PMZ07437.1 hypothetical protein C1Y06_24785 [Pseudomonas sp. FW306-02-H06C]PMZ16641.1 hypothetical protein C1Y08_07590 [Pseudomonas sp. FW306-02-F02-AA]PMZ19043.1 hypothetical protein C1Y09_25955 [Pseudomonas sp. FW306-02-F08-AA]PMZ28002.1 hypothetical protein C1Y05_10605 [Pseudomonas sp. FW306-02-F04-BA]